MAISRGLRKKSKAKAELEAKKKALALANPAPARRKKKKRKSYSDSSVGGVRLRHIRKPVRNRAIQRQKRQAIKEKKRLKKQQHKVQEKLKVKAPRTRQDDTDVIDVTPSTPDVETTSESRPMSPEDIERLRQYESNGDSEEEKRKAREEDTPENSPWIDPEEEWRKQWLAGKEAENDAITEAPKNYVDDVIYSTFDSLLVEMGGYDETLRKIVQDAIDMYGFTEAMNRLEQYMYSMNQKNTVFGIPLNYKDAVLKGLSRFAKDMWGRPLSVAEAQTYEAKLDYLWGGEEYDM